MLPWLFGLSGAPAIVTALALVGAALMGTGAAVGLLSGAPPLRRGLQTRRGICTTTVAEVTGSRRLGAEAPMLVIQSESVVVLAMEHGS